MGTGSHPLDYLIFIFLASVGTLQIAVAYAKIGGISFFNRPVIGYIVGSLIVIIAFFWFFSADKRIGHNIIAGSQQLGLFLAGIVIAVLVTVTITSIVKRRKLSNGKTQEAGLQALKHMTYFQVISRYFRKANNR
jgi:hypothetical protein